MNVDRQADWWVSQYEGKWAVCVMTCWKPRTAHIKAMCDDKAMAEQIVREHNIVRELEENREQA